MDILRTSTSATRLRKFRERSTNSRFEHYQDWRNNRYGYRLSEKSWFPTFKEGKYFSENLDWIGANLGDAHRFAQLRHTGWYSDSWCSDVIRGAVIKIRCKKGVIYMAATYCTGWDGTTHYANDTLLVPKGSEEYEHENAITKVAHWADSRAEREAEAAREDDAKSQAEDKISTLKDEIKAMRAEMLALVKAVREQRQLGSIVGPICTRIIGDIRSMRKDVSQKFERIANLQDDYWLAVS